MTANELRWGDGLSWAGSPTITERLPSRQGRDDHRNPSLEQRRGTGGLLYEAYLPHRVRVPDETPARWIGPETTVPLTFTGRLTPRRAVSEIPGRR
jgi:hypothetical protein